MWDERKAHRYEYLRTKQHALTDDERRELAALQQELDFLTTPVKTERPKKPLPSPREFLAEVLSLGAGAIATVGSVMMLFGISPGQVAQHPGEKGWDLFWNHLTYFGPCVVLSWVAFSFSSQKNRDAMMPWIRGFTFMWLLGFVIV